MLYDTGWSDAGFKSLLSENHIDNLCGWAGDLQTLVIDAISDTHQSNDYNVLYNKAIEYMGTTNPSSSFQMGDVLADTDAFNNYNKVGTSLLPNVFRTYYSSGTNTRYKDFTGNMGKESIRSLAGIYTDDWFLKPHILKWPLLQNVDVSDTQSIAVRDAFTDFIWNKVQSEG